MSSTATPLLLICLILATPALCIVRGYRAENVVRFDTGLQATLSLQEGGDFFGADLPTLSFSVAIESADRVRVRITDPNRQRYEIPDSLLPPPVAGRWQGSANFDVTYTGKFLHLLDIWFCCICSFAQLRYILLFHNII